MVKDLKEKIALKTILVALAIIIVVGYSSLELKNFWTGPTITLYSPENGASLTKKYINIRGKAERITKIYLNGKKIFTDEKGNFTEPLLLSDGYNLYELRAEDQFGRQTSQTLQLVYKENKAKS